MILAGDAGGTKTALSLFDESKGKLVEHRSEKFSSQDYSSLEDIISLFLKDADKIIEKACVGIPGPVIGGEAKITNIAWELNESKLSKRLNIPKFKLVNDLVATAAIVPHLSPTELINLYEGKEENVSNTSVVIAPGTGLGMAVIVQEGGKNYIIPSEGGHVNFGPTNDIEVELLFYLRKKFGRVSYERVVSGMGLVNIFDFLNDAGYEKVSPFILDRMKSEDKAAVISSAALSGEDKLCVKVLDIFTSALGSFAGSLVLTLTATRGVYLGGGIPPKIIDKLTDGSIIKAYLDKGRLSYLVEAAPLNVIKDSEAALHGAAYIALEL